MVLRVRWSLHTEFRGQCEPLEAYDSLSPGNYWVSGNRIFHRQWIKGRPEDDGSPPDHFGQARDTSNIDWRCRERPFTITRRCSSSPEELRECTPTMLQIPRLPQRSRSSVNGDSWGNFVVDGSLLLRFESRCGQAQGSRYHRSFKHVGQEYDLPGSGYTQIRKSGNFLYVMKPDTVAVFDVTDASSISPVGVSCRSRSRICRKAGSMMSVATETTLPPERPGGAFTCTDVTNPARRHRSTESILPVSECEHVSECNEVGFRQWDSLNPGIPERLGGFLEFEPSITGVEKDRPAIPVCTTFIRISQSIQPVEYHPL